VVWRGWSRQKKKLWEEIAYRIREAKLARVVREGKRIET